MSSHVHTGGCACGTVRFEVPGRRLEIGVCHCRACLRAVGAPAVPWATVRAERLRIVAGAPTWWRSSATAERGFCARCGASLFFRKLGGGPLVDVTVGAFDQPDALAPTSEIWTASRLPWIHADPARAQHAGSGPDWTPGPAPAGAPDGAVRFSLDPADVDVLQLAELFRAVGFTRGTDPNELRAAVAGARWVVSAWLGDELVGFARAIADGVSNAYVSSVAVRPDQQRRGIGRGLMERLLAGRPGVKFVLRTSPAGERLYRSLGFVDAVAILERPRG